MLSVSARTLLERGLYAGERMCVWQGEMNVLWAATGAHDRLHVGFSAPADVASVELGWVEVTN
jgi:hypothetical protein